MGPFMGGPGPRADTPASARAAAEARRLAGDRPVGTHHLLQAILNDSRSMGAQALASLGVEAETLKAALERLDPIGTSDEAPEDSGARRTHVEVRGREVAVVIEDEALAASLADRLEGEPQVVLFDQPAGACFPRLWRDVTRHLHTVAAGLEREAEARWTPPEMAEGWDVAAFAAVCLGGREVRTTLRLAEEVDEQEVRAGLVDWLTAHQPHPREDPDAGHLVVRVRTGDGGGRVYELSHGTRPGAPLTRLNHLVAHAILDLSRPPEARSG